MERPVQVIPARAQLWHAELPGGERGPDAIDLVAEVAFRRARDELHAVEDGEHVQAELPAAARLELDPVADGAPVDDTAMRQEHLGLAVEVVGGAEEKLVLALVEERRNEVRQPRSLGIAEREVERLDREDVGEVRPQLERELELDALLGMVDEDDVLLHPVADEAPPRDRDLIGPRARPPAGSAGKAAEKYSTFPCERSSGRSPLTSARGARESACPRRRTRSWGRRGRRARPRRRTSTPSRIVICIGRYSSRTIESWLACWRGLRTISSMFMCGGLVTREEDAVGYVVGRQVFTPR